MSVQLGKRIRGLRKLKGLNQQQLAHKLNISVSLLSNIERGVKKPHPVFLEKLVNVLGVSSEELFLLPKNDHKSASLN